MLIRAFHAWAALSLRSKHQHSAASPESQKQCAALAESIRLLELQRSDGNPITHAN